MSFFKKMTKEFDELKGSLFKDEDKKDKEKKEETHQGETRGAYDAPSGYGQQPLHEQQPQYGQQSQYGQPSYDQQQQPYGSHAAAPSGPPSGPPGVAPGWTAQWDPNSQRWYYLEQATGRTQWDPPPFQPSYGAYPSSGPGNVGPPDSYNRDAPHGTPYGGQPYESGQYGMHQGQYPAQPFGEQQTEKKKKDKGHGGLMAGAAGGLAVGAVGGALVGHAMGDSDSDSDHEHRTVLVPQQSYSYGDSVPQHYGQPVPQPYQDPIPAPLPDETASGSSVSSSDKEDVEEARAEYEEKRREAASGSASSSDREEAEEAREEYVEEYEETYD